MSRLLLQLGCVCVLAAAAPALASPTASAASRLPGAPAAVPAGHAHPPGAHLSYRFGGRRWPGRPARITYHNYAKGYARWVKDAVAAWNSSGARVRFVATSRRRAKVTIRYSGSGCFGFAQVGYSGRRAAVVLGRGCNIAPMAQIAAHELGHIIGLAHEDRRCAAMNSVVAARCGNPPQPWLYRCRLLEADDIRGAVRRYGGSVRPRAEEFCEQYPVLPPPKNPAVAAESTPDGPGARISWRNITSRFLRQVVIARRRDVCPTGPGDPEASRIYVEQQVRSGAPQSQTDTSLYASGRYCYVLFSVDEFNREGPASAPVFFDYTAPAPPPEEGCEDPDFC